MHKQLFCILPLFAAVALAQMTYTGVNLSGGEYGKLIG